MALELRYIKLFIVRCLFLGASVLVPASLVYKYATDSEQSSTNLTSGADYDLGMSRSGLIGAPSLGEPAGR